MDPKFKQKIRDNFVVLMEDTNALDLLPHLWADHAVSKNEKDCVEKHGARREQNSELYSIILRKGNHAYNCLIKAMISTEQGFLAQKLVINEEQPDNRTRTASDVVSERMPNGTIRFSIKSTTTNSIDNVEETNLKSLQVPNEGTATAKCVEVKVIIVGYQCDPLLVSLPSSVNVVKIKEHVELTCGIDIRDQVLTFQNKQMSDGESLESVFGETTCVIVNVIPRFIFSDPDTFMVEIILADVHDSDPIEIDIAGSDDIKKLKAKLKLAHPHNVPSYQLFLVYDGDECLEGNTLNHYGISEGSTLHCQTRSDYFPLRIRDTSNSNCFTVPVTGAMKLETLLHNIACMRKVGAQMYQLFYKGKRLLHYKTVLEIDRFANLSANEMKFTLVMPGMILVTVHYYGNDDYQVMDCYVRWNDNVASLKREIFEFMGVEVERQYLVYAGKSLYDSNSFSDLGINKMSKASIIVYELEHIMDLLITIQVSDDFHPTHEMKVAKRTTIKEMKTAISCDLLSLYPQILVPDMQFYLGICGADEDDLAMMADERTVDSYGLKHEDELTVFLQLDITQPVDMPVSLMGDSLLSLEESFYLPNKGVQENPFTTSFSSVYEKNRISPSGSVDLDLNMSFSSTHFSAESTDAPSLGPKEDDHSVEQNNFDTPLDESETSNFQRSLSSVADSLKYDTSHSLTSSENEALNDSKSDSESGNVDMDSGFNSRPNNIMVQTLCLHPLKAPFSRCSENASVPTEMNPPNNDLNLPQSRELSLETNLGDEETQTFPFQDGAQMNIACVDEPYTDCKFGASTPMASPAQHSKSLHTMQTKSNGHHSQKMISSLPNVSNLVSSNNHATWYTGSYQSSESRSIEVSSLRSCPNIEMSQVSLDDLTDALCEDSDGAEYQSCDEEFLVI